MKNGKKQSIKKLKVAIIADEIQYWGGAQDDILAFTKVFPNSTIYTSIYEEDVIQKFFKNCRVKTTFIQKMPLEKKFREEYFLLYPLAFRLLNLKKYDLVISVSSAFSKFVRTPKNVKHFMYCLTPPRYLWLENRSARSSRKITYKIYSVFQPILHKFWRKKDRNAARKADMVATNSNEVAKRVKKFYGINPKVLYPPVEMNYLKYNPDYSKREDWFVYIGRVEKYKGVELMIRACIKAKKKLKIAGKGEYLDEAKNLVRELEGDEYIKFLGYVEDSVKADLLFNSKGLIFPVKDEDFGIVPIEANASGCPVLAYSGGGVLETVVDGSTGKFFTDWTVDSLVEQLDMWDSYSFSPKDCKVQASKFSFEVFENKLVVLIDSLLDFKRD